MESFKAKTYEWTWNIMSEMNITSPYMAEKWYRTMPNVRALGANTSRGLDCARA